LFSLPGENPGVEIVAMGDLSLLSRASLGLLCSVRCPGGIVLTTYDFARMTPPDGSVIVGGFHSPMERTCLDTLIARHVPVIFCPARRLNPRGIPRSWDGPLAEQRLLILSAFVPSQRRVTRGLARQRNRFVAALSSFLFVPFASRGGASESLVRACLCAGKEVRTLQAEENEHLMAMGVQGMTLKDLLGMTAAKCVSPHTLNA
jgi:predicted Rossmann fold nucleotide-binding protein DprA/Smf involved in DNA uptake